MDFVLSRRSPPTLFPRRPTDYFAEPACRTHLTAAYNLLLPLISQLMNSK